MNFLDKIQKLDQNKNYKMFVDMDGVIASYEVGKPGNFDKKRPLKNNINILKEVSKLNNIEMHILSISKKDSQIKEKNDWIDINANFFKYENRHIISKESNEGSSKELKYNFLIKYIESDNVILVDDDNQILKYIYDKTKDIILYQDSELID